MKLSIIIPVYKTQDTLDRCLQSVLQQSFTNYEIILVDDESPDKCPKLCDEYAQIDARIKVIHKENGGLSSARNAGLDVCTSGGELIAFVDSDDWLELDMFEVLYTNLKEKNVDIACVGYYQCYMNKIVKGNFCKGKLYSGENLISEICEDVSNRLQYSNKVGKTITLKVKYDDFTKITRSISLEHPIYKAVDIRTSVYNLVKNLEKNKGKIRLLGVTVSNLSETEEEFENITISEYLDNIKETTK